MTATRTIERPTDKPAVAQPVPPKSANEVLARVDEDHNYRHEPIDMNTTGGLQKAIERNWNAIRALADYVDGKRAA